METSSIDMMEAAVNPAVFVRFSGKEIPVILKTLSSVEIQSCGDFSLINLSSDKKIKSKEDPLLQIARFAEIQHNVLKLAMINPTYEEVESLLLRKANVNGLNERMRSIVERFALLKNDEEKKKLEKEYALLEMRCKFIFPEDFLIDVFEFATEQDKSDIKKIVSENILLEAAIMCENKCLVSDLLCKDGYFSEFNKFDINKRAAIILHEHREKK
jgi:hypothetical protein